MANTTAGRLIDTAQHPIDSIEFASECRHRLDADGALVLPGFFTAETIRQAAAESAQLEATAFFNDATHNVYLSAADPTLPDDHPFNRRVISNKGLIADDHVPADSPIRAIYDDDSFRTFIGRVVGVEPLYPYPDKLSSIVISVAGDGMELGWHFDTSAFSITMLLQAADEGGVFEFIPEVRDADAGHMGFERVDRILDGHETAQTLEFAPGDLVMFRGRNALHRVTPAHGPTTRSLVIYALNERPDASMSDEALMTFFGRMS